MRGKIVMHCSHGILTNEMIEYASILIWYILIQAAYCPDERIVNVTMAAILFLMGAKQHPVLKS